MEWFIGIFTLLWIIGKIDKSYYLKWIESERQLSGARNTIDDSMVYIKNLRLICSKYESKIGEALALDVLTEIEEKIKNDGLDKL